MMQGSKIEDTQGYPAFLLVTGGEENPLIFESWKLPEPGKKTKALGAAFVGVTYYSLGTTGSGRS